MPVHRFTGDDVASLLTGGMSDLILFDRWMGAWETAMMLCLPYYDFLERVWWCAETTMAGYRNERSGGQNEA